MGATSDVLVELAVIDKKLAGQKMVFCPACNHVFHRWGTSAPRQKKA